MATLPTLATGELIYNGFRFPPAVHVTAQATPVSDSTGRYTKWVTYVINVECVLYPGCDDTLADGNPNPNSIFPSSLTDLGGSSATNGFQRLRHLLSRQGQTLTFTGKGFGDDFVINTSTQDVKFGPKPKVIRWEPIGNNKAVRLVWAVEVSIADCANPRLMDGRISEFAYSIEYGIDDMGMTTRTVTGFMAMVNRLIGSGVPNATADRLREYINVTVPYGFKRESQQYTLSTDGQTIQFTVVDRELETDDPYHAGMTDQRATHTIKSHGGLVGHTWLVSLNADYKVAKGADKGRAWQAFLYLVKSRRQAVQHARLPTSSSSEGERASNMAFPVHLQISDDVYGRGMRFSMSWLVFSTYKTVLKSGGLFAHEENTAWHTWHSSLLNKFKTWNQRGHAQLRAIETSQAAVTLCNSNYPQPIQDAGRILPQVGTYSLFESKCPTKEESWVRFKPKVTLLEDHKTMVAYPTGGVDDYKPRAITPASSGTGLEYERGSGDVDRPKVHTQGLTRYRVRFEGVAIRVGHKIPKPVLVKYGGAEVSRPIGKGEFKQWEVGVSESCPIYRAEWSQEYELYSPPKGELIELAPTTAGFPR